MKILLQDLRYGFAMMVKKPAFTLIAISALMLGIGANTAIFSIVNSVLLRPLPYDEAEQLVRIHDSKPPELERFPVSPGNFTRWRASTRSFERVAAYHSAGRPLVLTGGARPEQLEASRVSANLFALLRVKPALGRTFSVDEEESGRDRVLLLSHSMWQQRFGGDPRIVGRTVTLSDNVYTIVGVMPPSFRFPSETTQVWVPLGFTAKDRTRHGSHYLTVLARLRSGTPIESAQAEMNAIAQALARELPNTNGGWSTKVVAWQEDLVGSLRTPLAVLSAAVFFVLLIACVNVTNLLLARATSRSREVAIRVALGASRGRIVRQLLTESLLLAVTGGALGLLFAIAGVRVLGRFAADTLPAIKDVSIDARVLGFTLLASILTGVIFGLAPALQLAGSETTDALKDGARGTTGGTRRTQLRKILVVAEVGLALVLLVAAGLLIRSFTKLRDVQPGFDAKNVLTMNLSLSRVRYPDDAQKARFAEYAVREVSALPGVESAAVVSPLPFGSDTNYGFAIDGQPIGDESRLPTANHYVISADYFRAMRVPINRGRAFTDRDRDGAPRVAIINETMARTYFPSVDPIGRRIYVTNGTEVWREIVGVAGDVKQYGLDTDAKPQIYEPYLQEPFFAMNLILRSPHAERMADAATSRLLALDKDQPVTGIRTLESLVADSMARRRFSMTLLTLFASAALLLAAMGIYGVMAYFVSQRTHEIGIRMSLGAHAADILRLIVGEGARLVATGVAVGLAAAFLLTRAMSALLFGVSATDLPTFAGVAVMLLGVALLASYIPARRATKLDLVVALRQE
ncbi:MAG TPA: ABC transporter permease [Thermoanaerobaculia bacterium]|nr:ABC transporter permease [Thermoanaerobaculia bacterium]